MLESKIYFVSGIDTDAGKSYATGYLARLLSQQGRKVITQKLVQTGSTGISEDIELHRRIMGCGLLDVDLDHTTAPIRYSFPASPALAAELDGTECDLAIADRNTHLLGQKYDLILIEGAGGLMVPVNGFETMIDYAAQRGYPLILVTNPKLGSVNHTCLSLEACRTRGIRVEILAYNMHPATSPVITDDTRKFFIKYIERYHPDCRLIEIPFIGPEQLSDAANHA